MIIPKCYHFIIEQKRQKKPRENPLEQKKLLLLVIAMALK
jgi:hypothetical protein